MKYKKQLFDYAVKDYKRILGDLSYKSFFLIYDLDDEKAFYSIAPLSQAIHELHSDLFVISNSKQGCIEYDILKKIWEVYKEHEFNKRGQNTKYLSHFIKAVSVKFDNSKFEKLFKAPALIIESGKIGFNAGKIKLPYKYKWFKPYKLKQLTSATQKIWKNVFALKKKEKVQIDLPLIPPENILKLPLEDYLDSYAITWLLMKSAKSLGAFPVIKGKTVRVSPFEPAEHIFDLLETLQGCEHCKKSSEAVFKSYSDISKIFKLKDLVPPTAELIISPQGFRGRHFFGECIGYPTSNGKSRWDSPAKMFLKQSDEPQSYEDDRLPMTRIALTETLPIDVFVETTNINYKKFRDITRKLYMELQGCIMINVVGSEGNDSHSTNLLVDISHRKLFPDYSDVTTIVDKELFKKTKISFGRYTNIPGGEVFFTPQSMQGTFVGDVVMHTDRSVKLSSKHPIIVEVQDGRYQIIKAEKDILLNIEHVKEEHLKILFEKEKSGALPQEFIESQKSNFDRIGEFAINTHPTAKICDYLVVNEKIARMIHIALGMGFEKDRQTVYHFDIVIDAAKQKLDIYGVKPDGSEVWILKKGRMVI
ncbi:hypothetical protein J4418_03825 [Candidatus Woesearchaeota archaeon]|nr:hypothetical protein [Candidatus Woesearchaeota archaeon]